MRRSKAPAMILGEDMTNIKEGMLPQINVDRPSPQPATVPPCSGSISTHTGTQRPNFVSFGHHISQQSIMIQGWKCFSAATEKKRRRGPRQLGTTGNGHITKWDSCGHQGSRAKTGSSIWPRKLLKDQNVPDIVGFHIGDK